MKKNRTAKDPSGAGAGERIKWLFSRLWQGNQSRMAEELGFSRMGVHNVLSGRQAPGRRLLMAIGAHPKVNPAWVLTGEGEPLLAERQAGFTGGYLLPIYRQLPPGTPQDHQRLQSGEWYPVQQAFHGVPRYWYEVQAGDTIMHDPNQKVSVADLLLMDADPEPRRRPEEVHGLLGAVLVPAADDDKQVKLATLTYHPGGPRARPRLLASVLGGALPYTSNIGMPKPIPAKRRKILRERPTGERAEPSKPTHAQPIEVQPADIVAVCLMLVRRCYPRR
jgi:hypothetical protein